MPVSEFVFALILLFLAIVLPLIVAIKLESLIGIWTYPLFFFLMFLGVSGVCRFLKWELPREYPIIKDSPSELFLGLALTILALSFSVYMGIIGKGEFGDLGILAGVFLFLVVMLVISTWRKW
jgi:hypothetical protein